MCCKQAQHHPSPTYEANSAWRISQSVIRLMGSSPFMALQCMVSRLSLSDSSLFRLMHLTWNEQLLHYALNLTTLKSVWKPHYMQFHEGRSSWRQYVSMWKACHDKKISGRAGVRLPIKLRTDAEIMH